MHQRNYMVSWIEFNYPSFRIEIKIKSGSLWDLQSSGRVYHTLIYRTYFHVQIACEYNAFQRDPILQTEL